MSRRYTPKGEAQPVCGRKFCVVCGKWRHVCDFHAKRAKNGWAVYLFSECKTCGRIRQRERKGCKPKKWGRTDPKVLSRRTYWKRKADPQRYAEQQEYWRIYKDAQRREEGVPQREWKRGGARDKGYKGPAEAVDAGPFIEWLDGWIAHQDQMRYGCGSGAFGFDGIDRPVAGLEDLAELAGCSTKAFWRARREGRVTITLIDRVLIAAGADVYLIDLYPELYENEAAA